MFGEVIWFSVSGDSRPPIGSRVFSSVIRVLDLLLGFNEFYPVLADEFTSVLLDIVKPALVVLFNFGEAHRDGPQGSVVFLDRGRYPSRYFRVVRDGDGFNLLDSESVFVDEVLEVDLVSD